MAKKHIFSIDERADYSDINCHEWGGGSVKEHSHSDYYEVVIATSGLHFHVINGKKIALNKGDVIILSPTISHTILQSKETGKHYNIAVKTELFKKLTANKQSLNALLSTNGYLTVTPSIPSLNFIFECIKKIDNENFGAYSYTLVETILSVVFLSVMSASSEPSPNSITYYCYDAINKIENYSYIDKSISEIYKLYPLSHATFINEFKRLTGKTPSAYLLERKMEYAKKLLLTSDFSVLEIASEIGFDSVSHFIKLFKKLYGTTPLKYRKRTSL
jgi:AraC family cel operon transcriptional repressor